MGREIRRVPPTWEHPKELLGNYIPLYDESYIEASRRWMKDYAEWLEKYPSGFDDKGRTFWDWDGPPPDDDSYRPEWTEPVTAYQVYENVTEGTPVSPVFKTKEELISWLKSEWGLSDEGVAFFVDTAYVPSCIVSSEGVTNPGADTIEWLASHKDE